mmetsp:Transcript_84273/g.239039  ORF Transcript_84273/g.239039 Transcript_84273/m.239039 type:complete len:207 (+) Transcript_84273:88-708(+)
MADARKRAHCAAAGGPSEHVRCARSRSPPASAFLALLVLLLLLLHLDVLLHVDVLVPRGDLPAGEELHPLPALVGLADLRVLLDHVVEEPHRRRRVDRPQDDLLRGPDGPGGERLEPLGQLFDARRELPLVGHDLLHEPHLHGPERGEVLRSAEDLLRVGRPDRPDHVRGHDRGYDAQPNLGKHSIGSLHGDDVVTASEDTQGAAH